MSSEGPVLVEFVGTPGAGKTTLADQLVHALRDEGVPGATVVEAAREHASRTLPGALLGAATRGRRRRALLWALFIARATADGLVFLLAHRELARHVLGTLRARHATPALERHVLFWLLQLAGRRRFLAATARPGDVLVFDDGFLHRCVHVHASHEDAPDAARVAGYVDLLPRPGLVVRVVADLAACHERVLARGVWPHSRHLSGVEVGRYLEHAERAVELGVRRAVARGWQVVEVRNGEGDRDRAARALRESVVPLVAGVAPALPRARPGAAGDARPYGGGQG